MSDDPKKELPGMEDYWLPYLRAAENAVEELLRAIRHDCDPPADPDERELWTTACTACVVAEWALDEVRDLVIVQPAIGTNGLVEADPDHHRKRAEQVRRVNEAAHYLFAPPRTLAELQTQMLAVVDDFAEYVPEVAEKLQGFSPEQQDALGVKKHCTEPALERMIGLARGGYLDAGPPAESRLVNLLRNSPEREVALSLLWELLCVWRSARRTEKDSKWVLAQKLLNALEVSGTAESLPKAWSPSKRPARDHTGSTYADLSTRYIKEVFIRSAERLRRQ